MAQHDAQIIAVVGATGLQGGAVTRRLLQDHWPVRALTRNPDGKKVRAIAQLGVEVVKADLSDPASLERAFDGVYGVFSVQNHHISGYEEETRFPMPRWLFERFAGTDETTMWRWLGANEVAFDTGPTLAIHPAALTVREWLERKKAPVGPRR